jgi:site-specific DNA recombinase
VALVSDPSRIKCTSFERKYIGSGVYECGKCGGKMKAAQPGGRKTRAYVCRDRAHLLRSGPPLDDYVTDVLLWRLGQPDAHLMLDDRRIDIPALQAEQRTLQARLDELADQFAEGAIDAPRCAGAPAHCAPSWPPSTPSWPRRPASIRWPGC